MHYSKGDTSSISIPVTAFEYATFQNAPLTGIPSCDKFRKKLGEELSLTNPDYLQVDCGRYQRALDCYRDVYKLPANAAPAEKDLSTAARTQIEDACDASSGDK